MSVKSLKLSFKNTAFLLLILGFVFFLVWPAQESKSAEPRCQMLRVGQVPKKLLEIQNELVFLIGFSIEKYSQLITHALTTAHLVSKCDIGQCQKGSCGESKVGLGVYCDWGDDCSAPASGDDICPEESREGMKREYEKAKRIAEQDLVFKIPGVGQVGLLGKLAALRGEISWLEGELRSSASKVGSFDPKTHILLNCKEARDLGYIRTCKKEQFTIFGISLPEWLPISKDPDTGLPLLGSFPDSNLDYFICEKQEIQ